MKYACVIAVIVLTSAVLAVAQDVQSSRVCSMDGSWMGSSPAMGTVWTGVFDSDSRQTGPALLRYVGGDPSFGGLIPTARSFSLTVGTWTRTGPRSFHYTHITYGLDADSQPVYIFKVTGRSIASADCKVVENSNTVASIYDSTQDPFGNEPPLYGSMEDPTVNSCRRIPEDSLRAVRDPGTVSDD